MKILMLLTLPILLSGCLLETVGPIDRNLKPYGAHWVKEGGSDNNWQREWESCGGSANGDVETGLQSSSTSDEVFFKTLHEKRAAISTCMKNHGYIFQPSTFRSENP